MKKIIFIFIAIVSILGAETFTLTPSDDMYTDPNHTSTPPVQTELWTADFAAAGHFETILMRFDLSQLQNYTINSANLKLTRFLSCPNGGTTSAKICPITQNWNENSWVYTQNITFDNTNGINYVFAGPGGMFDKNFTVDITSIITNLANTDNNNFGFVIKAKPNQKFSKFYSKEHQNASFRPKLVIEATPLTPVNNNTNKINNLNLKNHPNPFNPNTVISFTLKTPSKVSLQIFNIKGKKVKTIVNKNLSAKTHNFTWNGTNNSNQNMPSGMYFYKLKTNTQVITKKMLMLK